MSSSRDTDPQGRSSTPPPSGDQRDHARTLARLGAEMERASRQGEPRDLAGGVSQQLGLATRRERDELAALRQAARRWSEELERAVTGVERERKELRDAAANRETELQREHDVESGRQLEEIDSLKSRLAEAEAGVSGDDGLREVKRLAYERERQLRQAQAEKLAETEEAAERKVSKLRAQREADNRSMIERRAAENARREAELESLRLRRVSEARVYGDRIEELARERTEERTSLEEAVAKLREKHEAERARLQESVESLEEALEEQESITVRLLEELGYVQRTERLSEISKTPSLPGEIQVADHGGPGMEIRAALRELHASSTPANLLREGLALFNETEHASVVEAISKSLGEPEVHVTLADEGAAAESPVITLIWPGMSWRRYVCEPRGESEPGVYLAGYGEGDVPPPQVASSPNARLDGHGLLSLGVRPL